MIFEPDDLPADSRSWWPDAMAALRDLRESDRDRLRLWRRTNRDAENARRRSRLTDAQRVLRRARQSTAVQRELHRARNAIYRAKKRLERMYAR